MCKILYPAVKAGSAVYKILYTAVYNISKCRVQSRYCRNSDPDQGCTKRVQPGKNNYQGELLQCRLK